MQDTKPAALRRYRPNLGADAQYHKKKLNEAILEAVKKYKKLHADELSKLTVFNASVEVRVKGNPDSPKILKAIIRRILTSEGAAATQAWIRRSVEQEFPQRSVYKDWGHPLPAYAHKYAVALLPSSGPAFASLQLPRDITLRELHAMAKVAWAKHCGNARIYKATITVSEKTLFINGQPFSISNGKTGKYAYRFIRANLNKLEDALRTASSPKLSTENPADQKQDAKRLTPQS